MNDYDKLSSLIDEATVLSRDIEEVIDNAKPEDNIETLEMLESEMDRLIEYAEDILVLRDNISEITRELEEIINGARKELGR